jgi:hypothetical protein
MHQIDCMNEQGNVIHPEANERDAKRGHSERSSPEQCENAKRRGAEPTKRELGDDNLRAEARQIDRSEATHV